MLVWGGAKIMATGAHVSSRRRRGVAGWRADRLTTARQQAGLKQVELAHLVGVAAWTVHAWEHRGQAPTARHLAMLAAALSVQAEWLAPLPPDATMRHLRDRVGLTQRQVAEHLGRGRASIAEIEAGRWWPTDASQWASLYKVNLSTLRRAWETTSTRT